MNTIRTMTKRDLLNHLKSCGLLAHRAYAALLVSGLCLCLINITFTSTAMAKETPPPGDAARDFDLPAFERITLDNGMRVTLVPFGKFPKATIRINVLTGNANESSDTWLSDLTTELMKEGTETRSAELIAKQTARMGGNLALSTGLDQTTLSLSVLSEFVPNAIGLSAEVLRQPALPAEELERLRSSLLRNLSLSLSQPQAIASAALIELLYPDHAYGTAYPTPEQLQAYTLDQVKHYYANNFGARRSHIMIAGQFKRDEVLRAIRRGFGTWEEGAAPIQNPAKATRGLRLKLIDRPGAVQSTVLLGVPVMDTAHPDARAFSQMQTMLGGYFSSRITANIREDKGYTYSPRSRVNAQLGTSYWVQSADITSEHTGDALNEIFREIRLMQNETPSAQETARTQAYQTGTFVLSHATSGGLLARVAQMALHGLPEDYLNNYLSHINGITPQILQEMAQKHLLIEEMTVVIVGDLATVEAQLADVPELAGATRL